MEKEIIIWTFISVFIVTAIITVLGIIKNFKWIEIDDKYLKVLSSALILEVVAVIIVFGASIFNEMSLETTHKKEIEKYESIINKNNKLIEKLNINLVEARKEIELKSIEISQIKKEKHEISFILSEIKKADDEEKNKQYTFTDAEADFNFQSVYFLTNTDNIDSISMTLLDSAVEKLGEYKNISLRLQPVTPLNGDIDLIRKRQKSIRAYLVTKGFLPQNIVFVKNSIYGNDSDEIYNEENTLLEKGVLLEIELKNA